VNGVSVGLLGRVDNRFLVEIGVCGTGRTDVVRLVRIPDVTGVLVGIRVDGHCADAQLLACAHHAHRYLPAISDEHLIEHTPSY